MLVVPSFALKSVFHPPLMVTVPVLLHTGSAGAKVFAAESSPRPPPHLKSDGRFANRGALNGKLPVPVIENFTRYKNRNECHAESP